MRGYNKKGMEILPETIIFMVLNILFCAALIVFAVRSGEGALVYEQAYAKQIALLIDKAEPNMVFKINVEKLMEISEKRGQSFENMVKIDSVAKRIIVSLDKQGGYSFQYFSGYDVSITKPSPSKEDPYLIFEVKKNG